MTAPARTSSTLTRDALTVLQPGFTGTMPRPGCCAGSVRGWPRWGCSAATSPHPSNLPALTAQLRAERGDVLVAIDEEGGDVTRLEARTGSSFPGNLALGAVDDPDLTRRGRP